MDWFGNILGEVNTILYSYVLIILLVGTGIFLTVKTKFIQFRLIGEMFKLITESAPTDKSGKKVYLLFRLLQFLLLLELEQVI